MTKIVKVKETLKKFNRNENSILDLAQVVLKGEVDALPVVEYLRKLKESIEEAEGLIKGTAMDELSKYSSEELKKGVIIGEAVMSIRSSAGRWKFDDPTLKDAEKRVKDLKELCKTASKSTVFDETTGAEIQGAEFNQGQETLVVSINKKRK